MSGKKRAWGFQLDVECRLRPDALSLGLNVSSGRDPRLPLLEVEYEPTGISSSLST